MEADVTDAANEELDSVVSALTPFGCRSLLTDLPVGVEVARVVRGAGRPAVPTGGRQAVWAVSDMGRS